MITADRTRADLARIAENMAMVVDPTARARLSAEYLTLLRAYHGKKTGPNFKGRVAALLRRTMGGRVHYKLLPSLGTISNRFYKAYADAAKSLERLGRLAARQSDLALRRRWDGFLRDTGFRLELLKNQAEVSSSNAHLSQYDALANEVLNMLAAELMPAEVEWTRRLTDRRVKFSPRGASAAVSVQAFPRRYNPGYTVPPWSLRQKKRPAKAFQRVTARGHYPALGGEFFEGFKALVTGAWGTAKESILETSKKVGAEFTDAAKRVKALTTWHGAQAREIALIREKDRERALPLEENLAERNRQLTSLKATLDTLAVEMQKWSYDTLDVPLETTKSLLGQAAVTRETAPATYLLFGDRVREARTRVSVLEKEAREADAEIGRVSGALVAGIGGLALAAAGVGAWFLLRGKRS